VVTHPGTSGSGGSVLTITLHDWYTCNHATPNLPDIFVLIASLQLSNATAKQK